MRFKDAATGLWQKREITDADVVEMLVPAAAAIRKRRGAGLNRRTNYIGNLSRADFQKLGVSFVKKMCIEIDGSANKFAGSGVNQIVKRLSTDIIHEAGQSSSSAQSAQSRHHFEFT